MQLVNQQYNHDPFEKMLQYAVNRDVLDRFESPSVRLSVEADLQMIGHYYQLVNCCCKLRFTRALGSSSA